MTRYVPFARTLPLTALLMVLGAGPVLAQTASFDDLRALRYYMQQNDSASTQAELRRLRIAFPDWQPPSDLNDVMAPPPALANVDEGAIWRQIERRDYAAARQLIEQGRQRGVGWTPPADMLRVLETNAAQDDFETAVRARNAGGAIDIVRRTPSLLSCERINNAWLLAEMYVLADQKSAALATYRNTLQSCQGYTQMQPTLEKSSAIATSAELRELFGVARQFNPGAKPQLDQLEARLLGASAPAPAPAPVAQAAAAPQPRNLAAAAPAVPAAPVAAQPAVSQGALPLRGDTRLAQVRRFKEQEQFASCLAASTAPRSLEVLYERSWCAYSHDRPTEALVGFQAAARAGDALGPNVRRDAHFGLALSYLSMNMTEQAAQTAAQVRLSDTQHRELETIVLDQRGVRAFRSGDFRQAIGQFNALETLTGGLRRDLAILRAYAYLNSGQRQQARNEFERLHSQLATAETREGINASRGP
ncbi:hypothetical protein LY56_02046 [Roseinatronobacter thiooxidans]|uniref:Tetratricopeptide repeat protein n=1 Tax=Roseinatronobacter thiooxidans TaxID=121821 RepID=A0A2W7Q220_9RHOB|nr:hypothetical protein [Roseinatronobacter thiooxidans]PZX42351.1 hypothetical protein LY56_02046 [Roseinatronobacter thiooxidans]